MSTILTEHAALSGLAAAIYNAAAVLGSDRTTEILTHLVTELKSNSKEGQTETVLLFFDPKV